MAEARLARALGGLEAAAALRLITLEAALAIGLTDVGLIAPGAWGDLTAIRLSASPPGSALEAETVSEAVLASGPSDVLVTWIAGREVFRT
jgi:cytosine/adenosine deaminase-related metal-dependent hydrolase